MFWVEATKFARCRNKILPIDFAPASPSPKAPEKIEKKSALDFCRFRRFVLQNKFVMIFCIFFDSRQGLFANHVDGVIEPPLSRNAPKCTKKTSHKEVGRWVGGWVGLGLGFSKYTIHDARGGPSAVGFFFGGPSPSGSHQPPATHQPQATLQRPAPGLVTGDVRVGAGGGWGLCVSACVGVLSAKNKKTRGFEIFRSYFGKYFNGVFELLMYSEMGHKRD
jgi:hypothetical protein